MPAWVMSSILVVMTAAIGWLDFVTSWELSLFVIYALPIMLAVWYGGQSAGIFVAALCAAAWWLANESVNPYETLLGYVSRHGFKLFAWWRIIVGALGLVALLAGL